MVDETVELLDLEPSQDNINDPSETDDALGEGKKRTKLIALPHNFQQKRFIFFNFRNGVISPLHVIGHVSEQAESLCCVIYGYHTKRDCRSWHGQSCVSECGNDLGYLFTLDQENH